jgi:hypothetical protein
MSLENILFGEICHNCQAEGITCNQNGLFLGAGPFRQTFVNIDDIGSFRVPGSIKNCEILTGKSSKEIVLTRIKRQCRQIVQKIIDEKVAEVVENIDTMSLDSTNWAPSK